MGFLLNYLKNVVSVGLGREPIRPLLFSYYVTHRCELNCRYCCDGDGKRFKEDPVPELSVDEAARLFSILRMACDTLDITGGEPMVREDLEEILASARRMGFRTVLNTKGVGLNDRPDIMRLTDVLVLSLDTLDPGVLSEVIGRPKATAEKVIEAVHFALSKRKETGTKLVLSAVATPANLTGVWEVRRFALEQSIAFNVSPEIVGTTVHPKLRDNFDYDHLIGELIRAKKEERGILGVPRYLQRIRDFGPFHCHPLLMPTIKPDGRMVYPCLESKRAEISLLETGSYPRALEAARERAGDLPECKDGCHLFCHMAISLYQRHPFSALGEIRHWGMKC
jgi:MoaA/NifB/PqqE/SkfB family radical SAM enzyme